MKVRRPFRILAGWFVSGLLFAALTLWLAPMAGLFVLMMLVSVLMILVAPPIHILITRGGTEVGTQPASLGKVLLISVGAIVLLIVLLGATGLFNFA